MSRGLTTAQINALTAETVRRAFAVELEFDSGTSRIVTAPHDIVLDGNTFIGGTIAGISEIEESAELGASSISAVLAGIPRDAITLALNEPFQNRPATVWLVVFDDAWVPLDPIVLFRGRIDEMVIDLGATARVSVTLSNRLVDWERPNLRRYSDEEQQARHAGDFGFQYAAAMATKEITWPSKEWFRHHPNG